MLDDENFQGKTFKDVSLGDESFTSVYLCKDFFLFLPKKLIK
jgi:hypothetical protein